MYMKIQKSGLVGKAFRRPEGTVVNERTFVTLPHQEIEFISPYFS